MTTISIRKNNVSTTKRPHSRAKQFAEMVRQHNNLSATTTGTGFPMQQEL